MGAAILTVAAAVATPLVATHAQSSPSTFRSAESEAQVATIARPQETRASRSEQRQPFTDAQLKQIGQSLRAVAAKHAREVAAARARQAALRQAKAQAAARQRARAVSYAGGSVKSYAARQVAAHGWSSSQFGCLDSLWERESGWSTYAANSSGAYGIPQALPGSKMASAGADWRTNPYTQIRWGLGYISGRYGSPCGALAHSNSYGYY